MILKVFAVYDSKLAGFLPPFTCTADIVALRAFQHAANDPQSQVCGHPEDFTLFEIGTFDDDTGQLTSIKHVSHGLAAKFKERQE